MIRRGIRTALFFCALLGAAPALADPRLRVVPYDVESVIPLPVAVGFAAVIELARDERIEDLIVGNSGDWQITANRSGDRVVVKPLAGASSTNMIVLTDARRYVFSLEPSGGEGQSFVVRFSYPNERIVEASPVAIATYSFRGAKALFPLAMRDDGRRTVITWDSQTPLPAIFALDKGSSEAIVNGRVVGGDYVVEGTAAQYVFRLGSAQAVAKRRMIKVSR